ncbi:MAG: hypothetical protein M0Z47_04120 [Actinomycetota bacterium]|nr:hypothetical protein [Actinomycetota bacterium]
MRDMPSVGIYLSDALHGRIQRLKERGVELNASAVAQRALEAAVEAEESALEGDRLRRLVFRLQSTRSAVEEAVASGLAAGRTWAEDVAAFSELKAVAAIEAAYAPFVLDRITFEPVVTLLGHDARDPRPGIYAEERIELPDSVPTGPFDPYVGERFQADFVLGFLKGATGIFDQVVKAMPEQRQDEDDVHRDAIPF